MTARLSSWTRLLPALCLATALAADPPVLVVRLCGPDGRPLRGTCIHLCWRADNSAATAAAITDAEGRLELAVEPPFLDHGRLCCELRHEGRFDGRLLGQATITLRALVPGRNDRGDVRLLAEPRFASGTVVDVQGQPVAGARLRCRDERGTLRLVETDAQGTFSLHLRPPHPRHVQLETAGDEWFFADEPLAPREVSADDPPLRLVLRASARLLVGTEHLPADLREEIVVACTDGAGRPGVHHARLLGTSDHLRLPAGTWDLAFALARSAAEPFVIAGVRADAGVVNHDARLLQLDWHRFASVATVRVAGPDGVPDCTVWRLELAGPTRGLPTRDGMLQLLVPKDGLQLLVDPHDRALRGVDLGTVTGDRAVALQKAPRLRLVLSSMPALPADVQLLGVVRVNGQPLPACMVRFDADGRTVTFGQWPGRHAIVFELRRAGKTVAVPGLKTAVEMGEADLEHRIEVDDARRAVIESMAARMKE